MITYAATIHFVTNQPTNQIGTSIPIDRIGRLPMRTKKHETQRTDIKKLRMTIKTTVLPARRHAIASAGIRYGPVSVRHKLEFYRNGWTNLAGFGMRASLHLSYTVLKGNLSISKNKGTSLWNFVPNSGLRKFRFNISIIETCYLLSSQQWTITNSYMMCWRHRQTDRQTDRPDKSSSNMVGPPSAVNVS